MGDVREGEADDVEVVAFDAGNEAAGLTLDGVGAGFVVGFAGGEVAGDVVVGKLREVDEGVFDESAALGVREANESDAGEDGVGASGKLFEHVAGIVGGARLAEDVAVEGDDGVGSDDDGGSHGAGGDELGFGAGETQDVVGGGFARKGSFVDGGGHDLKGKAGVVEDCGPAGRRGGENEFHEE